MSREKYRDFYSDYHEGSLEPGLKVGFEEKLKSDPEMQADLASFERMYDGLGKMRSEEIPVPDYLSARIFDRLEEQTTTSVGTRISLLWRNIGFAGLAATALAGGLYAISISRSPDVMPAGVLPSAVKAKAAHLQIVLENDHVYSEFDSPASHDLSVSTAPQDVLLRRYHVAGRLLRTELVNPGKEPTAFLLRVDREPDGLLAVVPGSNFATKSEEGSGDLTAFAIALSRRYRVPVSLKAKQPDLTLSWQLKDDNVQTAAVAVLESHGLNVDVMPGGLVVIDSH